MDIKNRVMGDQPNDFLHKLASIVPGYDGYMDRERRRDADKLLRIQLAHKFSEQHSRLARVQQTLLRSRNMEELVEVDRLASVLQRFIDRLSTAIYGYTGLFDPIKVEAIDLDQLYTFDMALASGVDDVSSAIDALEAAAGTLPEMPPAVARLSDLLDELNTRLNQRADLLTSGQRLPDNQYRAMVRDLTNPPFQQGSGPSSSSPGASAGNVPPSGTTGMGAPTTNIGVQGGAATSRIETGSSPASTPGAPGHDIVEGLETPTASDLKGVEQMDAAPTSAPPLSDHDQKS